MARTETAMSDEKQSDIETAAERGAQRALERIGLGDKDAGQDIREMRTWLESFRVIRKGFTQTTVRIFTVAFWLLLLGGLIGWIGKKLGVH